jgi:peptide/nickel transport system permease protein
MKLFKLRRLLKRPNALVGGVLIAVIVAIALVSAVWTPADPLAIDLRARLAAPGHGFLFGRDEFGRDVLSRLMAGAWASVSIAALTVALAVSVGTFVGLFSGFFRGWLDRVLMAINDAALAFPGTLLALALIAVVGPNRWGIVLALGVAYTPAVVRVVRGTVLSLREKEFVEASRALGNSSWFTLWRHVLPNSAAPIAVLATSMFGWVVLAESALSFLGLGVPPPEPTWGNMLAGARPYLESAPWLAIAPGVAISLTLLGINLLGDAVRDHLDPRMASE